MIKDFVIEERGRDMTVKFRRHCLFSENNIQKNSMRANSIGARKLEFSQQMHIFSRGQLLISEKQFKPK